MTRKMLVVAAIVLIAVAPVASASPSAQSLASLGDWFSSVVELIGDLLPSLEAQGDDPDAPDGDGSELGIIVDPGG